MKDKWSKIRRLWPTIIIAILVGQQNIVFGEELKPAYEVQVTTADQTNQPEVNITVSFSESWVSKKTKVYIGAEDEKKTGTFVISKIEVKVTDKGTWIDITDEGFVEITKDCNVSVRVTDTMGNTYTKTRFVSCFDTQKPTVKATISEGVLHITGNDTLSGVATIYVNGYEFKELFSDTLILRLQQFDTGYEKFNIQAVDKAGNISDQYSIENPYYIDPKKQEKSSEPNQETPIQLPIRAEATKPTEAKATVINESQSPTNKQAAHMGGEEKLTGKSFYTIQTKSEKIFYLVIDNEKEQDNVYFLTEASENDLLNFTGTTAQTIPQNGATVVGLPEEETDEEKGLEVKKEVEKTVPIQTPAPVASKKELPKKNGNVGLFMLMGIAVVAVGGGYYYMKFIKGKNSSLEDEFDESDEDVQTYPFETTKEEE